MTTRSRAAVPRSEAPVAVFTPGGGNQTYPPPVTQVTIPNTEVRIVPSSIVDQDFRVSVALPDDYATSARSYPVLLVLDADGFFGTAAETVRMLQLMQQGPELLVVGVGYPVVSFQEALGLRVRDLTPTEDRDWLEEYVRAQPGRFETAGSGRASEFLQFLNEELMPLIHATYRTDRENLALTGHSFGGLFSVYALFHAPDAFARYIISSPSMWWDRNTMLEFEARHAAENAGLRAKVFMSAGSLEESMPAPLRNEPAAFVTNVHTLADRLLKRGYEGLDLTTHVFEDEMHASVYPAALSRGLRVVFGQG